MTPSQNADRFWADVDADIRITLGIEHVEGDEEHVVMTMPFKPEISQATGLYLAGALIQLADTAATWLCHLRLRASGAAEGAFAFAVQISSNRSRQRGLGLPRHRSRPARISGPHRDGESDRGTRRRWASFAGAIGHACRQRTKGSSRPGRVWSIRG